MTSCIRFRLQRWIEQLAALYSKRDGYWWFDNGRRARYVKLQVAHASGMQGTFSLPPRDSDPDMHHGTCVTRVPWCLPGSQTGGFLWSRKWGKRSQHSRRMRNQQFYVSDKRPVQGQGLWKPWFWHSSPILSWTASYYLSQMPYYILSRCLKHN